MIYAWVIENLSEEGRQKFDAKLDMPPASATREEIDETPQWSQEGMANEFMAAMAQRGGAGRVTVDGVKTVDEVVT